VNSNIKKHPISNIEWLPVNTLYANDWNPNVVLSPELKLLEHSLLRQGWIQPVLVGHNEHGYQIIDGFHRHTLVKTSQKVYQMTNGLIPCAVLQVSEAERMLITVRINRAKGNHIAFRMHELVTKLYKEMGLTLQEICEGIGADKHEVETLMMEDVFTKKNVANTPYSKSWYPRGSILTKGRELKPVGARS
jgi:hypothetical protein